MTKVMFRKSTCFILAVVMIIACTTMTTFAAEAYDPVVSENLTLEYAKAETWHSFVKFENQATLGVLTTPNDNRIHRVIFDTWFTKPSSDRGVGNIKLTVIVYQAGVSQPIYQGSMNMNESQVNTQFKAEFAAPKNANLTFVVDASSVNPNQSNGNYRSAALLSFAVYSD